MTNTEVTGQPATAPEPASIGELNLADYRAQRAAKASDKEPAAAATPKEEDESIAEGGNAGEEDSTAEDTTEQGERPAKKKGGFQRKLEGKDREIEELKRQLAEKSAAKPAEEPAKPEAKATAAATSPAKPKLEDFDSLEDFTDALTDWKADERDRKRAAEAESKKVLDGWNSRQAEAKKEHSDYDEVIEAVSDIKLGAAHQGLFLESELGAEIAYQLASDPAELKKFAGLSPIAAAKYFGKLEAKFSADAPEPETRGSNAPRPIRPVGGRSSSAGVPDVSKLSLAAYRAARTAGRVR